MIAANMLHVMPQPDDALSEVARVLKPNGIFIAATFVYDDTFRPERIKPLEMLGFKTYYKWSDLSFREYVASHGFEIFKSVTLPANGLSECVLFCRKH